MDHNQRNEATILLPCDNFKPNNPLFSIQITLYINNIIKHIDWVLSIKKYPNQTIKNTNGESLCNQAMVKPPS